MLYLFISYYVGINYTTIGVFKVMSTSFSHRTSPHLTRKNVSEQPSNEYTLDFSHEVTFLFIKLFQSNMF